jgi:CDP-diacylglycerol--glycerol-3-phosphate 3-phosphatidyltransferase
MVTIYDLKPRFQALLRPLAGTLVAAGATANGLTLAALALSIAAGTGLALWPDRRALLLALPMVLLLRMALNALDGMVAREFGQISRRGALLNELGDVLADTALYLPFALLGGIQPVLLALVVILGVIGEMAGVVAVQIGAERRYDGPLGKSDRAFLFALLALLLGLGLPTGPWIQVLLGAMAALGLVTIGNRARQALATAGPLAGALASPQETP